MVLFSLVDILNVCVETFLDLKRRLAEWYQKEYNNMPFIPSMHEYEVPMRQLYVAPKIVGKDDKTNSQVRIKTFTEFLMKGGCLCKNIFLVGEPGTGKSTFTQNLALQWSELQLKSVLVAGDTKCESNDDFQDKNTLNMIDILFYVSLRDANNLCSYIDIVRDQLLVHIYTPSELDLASRLVQSVLECPTSCILSDGLDEWSHPEHGQCSCPSNMKGRTPVICQPHSAITITTSRPWRMTQYPPKESKIEKRIDIEGTGSVNRLGEKVVNILNERSENHVLFSEIEDYVQEKDVSHLMTIPILLLQIVCLFFDGKEVSNSQSKIYASIFDMMMGRQPQESTGNKSCFDPKFRLFADKKNVIRYWTYFTEIAKLAFEQLFPQQGHSSVVFNSNTCHLDDEVKRFALKYGILSEKKSRSFSCRSSSLSFIHKTFQEFLAAVHMGIHEDLFEMAVETRYSLHDFHAFKSYISDLSQVFIYMCGLNINMAEKMSKLVNTHVNLTWECEDMITDLILTDLITKGVMEAENNGLINFRLHLYYIHFHSLRIRDTDLCWRILKMNESLVLRCKLDKITIRSNVIFENCTRLQYLTWKDVHIEDHYLQLPASITSIDLDYVTVRGGVLLDNCTKLRRLIMNHVCIGDHTLQLPPSITHFELCNTFLSEGLSLENCTMLEKLTLEYVKIRDHTLQLPPSITHFKLCYAFLSEGVSLENCTHINTLTVETTKLKDNMLKLPASIASIFIASVDLRGGLSLDNCIRLEKLTLINVDIGDHKLNLPPSITCIHLDHVTVSGDFALENCTGLASLRLAHIELKKNMLKLSASFTCIYLDHVNVSGEFALENCTALKELTLIHVDIGDHCLQFPASITSICIDHVTVPSDSTLENCTGLSMLALGHMNLKDNMLKLPAPITYIALCQVTLSDEFSLENCTGLSMLRMVDIDLKDNMLKLPASLACIHIDNVNVSGEFKLENCTGLDKLTLTHVDIKRNLQLPASITRIVLVDVTLSEGVSLLHCSRLDFLCLNYVDMGYHKLQLPASITYINLDHVTVPGGISLENCTMNNQFIWKHVDLGDHNLQPPAFIICIDLDHVTVRGGVSLENCTRLKWISLKHVDLNDNTLKLPASIAHIHFDNVTVTGGVSFQDCKNILSLELNNVKYGDHDLAIPDTVLFKRVKNVFK